MIALSTVFEGEFNVSSISESCVETACLQSNCSMSSLNQSVSDHTVDGSWWWLPLSADWRLYLIVVGSSSTLLLVLVVLLVAACRSPHPYCSLYPPSERSETGGYKLTVLLAFPSVRPSVCAHSYLRANISKTV